MKKMNLKRIQVVAGVAYGPGEVEVDDAVAKRLKGENLPAPAKESGSGGLAEDFPYRDLLVGAGFKSAQSVRDASDEQLMAIDGIGEARLKEIRKAQ